MKYYGNWKKVKFAVNVSALELFQGGNARSRTVPRGNCPGTCHLNIHGSALPYQQNMHSRADAIFTAGVYQNIGAYCCQYDMI